MYVAAIGRTRIRYNAVRAVADADHTVERIVIGPGANVVVRATSELLFQHADGLTGQKFGSGGLHGTVSWEVTQSGKFTGTHLYPNDRDMYPMVDYTYDGYRSLLHNFHERGFSSIRYTEAKRDKLWVLLRHDVDYDPKKALEVAEIEAETGMQSTFFFLLTTEFYNVFSGEVRDIINEISNLGHDIGLHFDTSYYWDEEPNVANLRRAVQTQQDSFETVCNIEIIDAVAFHNPPEWTLNKYFDGLKTTYEPDYFEEIAYESDSLYYWQTNQPFQDGYPEQLQVLTHPVLWGERSESLKARIRTAQQHILDRTNECVREESNIDWEEPSKLLQFEKR